MQIHLNPNREGGFLSLIPTLVQAGTTAYQAYTGTSAPTQTTPSAGPTATGPAVGPPTYALNTSPALTPVGAGMAALPPIIGSAGAMMRLIMTRLGTFSRGAVARKLIAIAKYVGIEAAATVLGISIADALGLLGEHLGKRRHRRRGISARDLRTTRRTTRRLIRAGEDLNQLCTCFRPARHYKRSCS